MNTQTQEQEIITQDQSQEPQTSPGGIRRLIGQVRRATRRRFSAEEKIRIVLEGFRRELPVSDLCRREEISSALYYSWLKDFMEAGKERLKGDVLRDATRHEVKRLQKENAKLKEILAETALEKELFKKSLKA